MRAAPAAPVAPVALVALLALGCRTEPARPVPALPACEPTVPGATTPIAWGFADLHAHPAIEVSFGQTHLVWGSATPDARPDATRLPAPAPCPVETHVARSGGPLDRTAHTLILPLVNQQQYYPHPMIGTPNDELDVGGWPNGRDVLHQMMDTSSLRRAYEGGLRLLFASVTDSQALTGLLRGAHFADAVRTDREREIESARRQLDRIQVIADEQSSWMEIAPTPEAARAIIASGRLALVLSLEMDGLTLEDVRALVRDDGVGHVVPIHLVDNDLGGTAAFSPIFNAGSALESEMFGAGTLQYISVAHSTRFRARLPWPLAIAERAPPVLFEPGSISYPWYRSLAYESTCWCDGSGAMPWRFRRTGHANTLGLTAAGEAFVGAVIDLGLLLDVSHMSEAATARTLELARARGYPVIASHGGVGPRPDAPRAEPPPVDSERTLSHAHALEVAASGGVIGLGTQGHYDAAPILVGRGGPALEVALAPSPLPSCIGEGPGCAPILAPEGPHDPSTTLRGATLHAELVGSFPSDPAVMPFAVVTLSDPSGDPGRAPAPGATLIEPVACSSTRCTIDLAIPDAWPSIPAGATGPTACGAPGDDPLAFVLGDLESIAVAWVRGPSEGDATCVGGGADVEATIQRFEVRLGDGTMLARAARDPSLTPAGGSRGSVLLYARGDQPRDPTGATDIVRVAMISSPDAPPLPGAGTTRYGSEVCVRIRERTPGGECASAGPALPTARGCGVEWTSISHRGAWPSGTRFDGFVRVPVASDPCGLDVVVIGWEGPASTWSLDEVRLDRITDPALAWTDEYLRTLDEVFAGEAGRLAIGSDINGLQVQMPITARSPSGDGYEAWGCTVGPMPALRVEGRDEVVSLARNGLGTYGLLADLVALSGELDRPCLPGEDPARSSLLLSAEATLRTWEHARAVAAGVPYVAPPPLPTVRTTCAPVPLRGAAP